MRKFVPDLGQPQPFLPRYEVISPLGEGGVATVYKVRDLEEGSIKALKALKHTRGRSVSNIRRFEEEYAILRNLHHPSLPHVYDYGVTREETRFILMEFVEGQALDDYFSTHKEELWLLCYELSEALAFIHEHELLHLDLKPKNVLVRKTRAFGGGDKPLLMLLDFGVSYRRDAGGKVAVVGTPGYMAPEVIRSDEQLTRAVDYYSLGVTLYQLITGTLPFKGSLNDILQAQLAGEITFDREEAEYTDLYPRIKALMHRDPQVRLEAFGDFRSSVALKAGSDLKELEKAYGMGYLGSLGMIGKEGIWDHVRDWVNQIAHYLEERERREGLYESSIFRRIGLIKDAPEERQNPEMRAGLPSFRLGEQEKAEISTADLEETDPLPDTTVKLEQCISEDFKDTGTGEEDDEGELESEITPEDPTRVILISGASGSGKSYIIEALNAELKMKGLSVAVLSDSAQYEALVSLERHPVRRAGVQSIDPQSIIIDRFVQGWERLMEEAQDRGVVLVVDGYERISKEVKEFLEYVGKRLELMLDEGSEPGLFILVTGSSPKLKKDILNHLPNREADELVIPPPGKVDLENILAHFHGHMPGVEDRRRLEDYLARNGRSSGALLGRMKEALVRGDLGREGGKWHFSWSPTRPQKSDQVQEDYYQVLLLGLEGKERELISSLSCHKGPIQFEDFMEVTGIGSRELRVALEKIEPYRVIESVKGKQGERIELVSEAVRDSFYRAIEPHEKNTYHKRYLEHFSKKQVESDELYKSMIYHYEQVGESERALEMRIRALRKMKRDRDVFGIRQCCDAGISFLHELEKNRQSKRVWHVERYFLKQWIEAEWMVSNYRSLVDVVDAHIIKRNRRIPLSFCYKYGTALERSGELKACKELITSVKRRIRRKKSEAYAMILLLEASILQGTGAYDASVKVLDRIGKEDEILDSSALARIYILYMLNYESIGDKNRYLIYMQKGEEIASEHGHFEHLLTASYSKILSYLNSSHYEKAKDALRVSIRLANKHRVYRRLCSVYFLASAVYYEEGKYKRAIKYLDKAIRIALNMGMVELVNDLTLRYALIYQNLGYYGNAIRFAETAKNQVSQEYRTEQYFYALLILFDLHNSLKHSRAASYKLELEQLVPKVEAKYRLALYHLLSGDYYYDRQNYNEAYEEYEVAFSMYESIEYADDAVRCSIRMAHVLIDKGEYDSAGRLLKRTGMKIKKMESVDLNAEFYMASLALQMVWSSNERDFNRYLNICEEIWPKISDINILMRISAVLFRANVKAGRLDKAVAFFNQYYSNFKEVTGNLPSIDYVNQFTRNKEFRSLVEEFQALAKKSPSQPVA